MTPREIVKALNEYIVGQGEAKKSIAIALRNRIRRRKLPLQIQEDIIPKNILMIGPTGVGKTEIARRISKMTGAPFVKVEATKFTEVGYVGRDVESMVRDLVETSIHMVKTERMNEVADRARDLAEIRLSKIVCPNPSKPAPNPFEAIFGSNQREVSSEISSAKELAAYVNARREKALESIKSGKFDRDMVEIEIEDKSSSMLEVFSGSGMEEMGINFQDIFNGIFPKRFKKQRTTIENARRILTSEEANKLIDMGEVIDVSIKRAEETGIIFIDEIDKITGKNVQGPDVSREGVQRDILPIVEGSTINTKYGPVKTDHILFIAAGAFHMSGPSDLIPELQGRFPLRVELKPLSETDLKAILIEPKNSLIKQYMALIETEGIKLHFSEDAIDEIARITAKANRQSENIGARRLHTIMEKLLEDVSFQCPELGKSHDEIFIDKNFVRTRLEDIVDDKDLSAYIL